MSATKEQRDGLVAALLENAHHAFGLQAAAAHAMSILGDPQAHIDALVEAGVLVSHPDWPGCVDGGTALYRVVQPHVHEWTLLNPDHHLMRYVYLTCKCGEILKFDRNPATVIVPGGPV